MADEDGFFRGEELDLRSSCSPMFYKLGVLKNSSIFNNSNSNNNNNNNSIFILGNNVQLNSTQNNKNTTFTHK